jgi:hypothetical protein
MTVITAVANVNGRKFYGTICYKFVSCQTNKNMISLNLYDLDKNNKWFWTRKHLESNEENITVINEFPKNKG